MFSVNQNPAQKTETSETSKTCSSNNIAPPSFSFGYQMNDQNINLNTVPNRISSKSKGLSEDLSSEEASLLIAQWEANNFRDFNTWSQIAGTTIKISFETYNLEGDNLNKKAKTELCNFTVMFPNQNLQDIAVKASGTNKKNAKKNALRMIVSQLAATGLIKIGLKHKKALQNLSFSNQSKSENTFSCDNESYFQDKKKKKIMNKKISKISSQMQTSLKNNDFKSACMALCHLSEFNSYHWKEICYVWSYALTQRKLEFIKSILDLINYKNISMKQEANKKEFIFHKGSEYINKNLFNKYKLIRMPNNNPFETYDEQNLMVNDPEIFKDLSTNQASQSFEINYDFLLKDITENFEQPAMINNETNSETYTGLLNQKSNIANNQTSIIINNSNNSYINNTNYFQNYNYNVDVNNNSPNPEKNTNKFNKEFPIDINKTSKSDFKVNAIINQKNNQPIIFKKKNTKDPNRNYHSYNLLEKMYESLLLTGDFQFAVQISELLYSTLLIDPEEFTNGNACNYYMYQKNLQFIYDLENIYYMNPSNHFIPISNCKLIFKKLANQILIFSPIITMGTLSDHFQIKFKNFDDLNSNQKFMEGDFVMIFLNNGPYQNQSNNDYSFIAKIIELSSEYNIKLEVLLGPELLAVLNDENKIWMMRKLCNFQLSDKTSQILTKFSCCNSSSYNLSEIITSPPQNKINLDQKSTEIQNITKNNLNPQQNEALKSALFNIITLIDGPKNSGKTVTAIEILLEWIRTSPNPVLICTNDHSSLNNLNKELSLKGIKAIRLDTLRENCLSYVNNFKSNPMLNFSSTNKHQLIKKILKDAQVVCCTFLDASSDSLKGLIFTRVIIDDAHKIPEILSLAPLLKKCQQLVLCGDSNESVVFTNRIISISKGYNISLFNRLIKQGLEPFHLNVQYHTDPSIIKTMAQLFQNNNIGFQQENQIDIWLYGLKWPNFSSRVLFVNVKGYEKMVSGSLQNLEEVKIILGILSLCLKCNYINSKNVGIITMYEEQKRRIINEILTLGQKLSFFWGISQELIAQKQNHCTSDVCEIETIDEFKSKEKDLIIFSAVRSNDKKNLGYLKDEKRIYKLLSKAQKGIIILGDIETLSSNIFWSNLISMCSGNRSLIFFRG